MKDTGYDHRPKGGVLIVVPTLNEAAHIGGVVDSLRPYLDRSRAEGRRVEVVVADGGSSDATRAIVAAHPLAQECRVVLMHNRDRLQAAALNRAVARHGRGMDWLIRLDAHARYPEDYCDILLQEARATGADSVVVAMRAVGATPFQRAAALAQNARLGNGGAAHRSGAGESAGREVEHGHHALMRLAPFREAGGYDIGFSHNEDAELDHRLRAQGARIWLTGRTGLDYLPRRSAGALSRQYFRFGQGRARMLRKHGLWPRPRQLAVIGLLPVVALALLAPLAPGLAAPLAAWAGLCLASGLWLALAGRYGVTGLAAGILAGVMHLAWSCGFWCALAGDTRKRARPTLRGPDRDLRPARAEE